MRVKLVKAVIDAGYENQVLLSSDLGRVQVGQDLDRHLDLGLQASFDVVVVEVHLASRQLDLFLGEGDRFMEQGLIPVRDLSITSGALLGATRYAMTDWAMRPDAHTVDEVVDELVRLFVAGLSDRA